MIRATVALRNSSGFKKHAADISAKAVGRGDLGTPGAKPTASAAPEETMMPWNGWFSSFLKDKLGDEKYEKLRQIVLYKPDDYTNFEQMPRPNTELGLSDEDPTLKHKFRHPSPGSQPPVRMPETDASFGNSGEDPYDVSYYKRDTGRRYTSEPGAIQRDLERIKLELLPQDDPRVKEAMEEFEKGPGSSPGNKGRFALAQTHYDPKGLRASMSTSFEATQESLDSNMPDHLPTPVWMDKQEEIVAWYEERDLPVAIGGTGFGQIGVRGRVARW
mmetsp:Transcript_11177/g.24190  ORF Transcript_11177/g.24190 Transcript_11177/m.24190 type:complete len:274 (+) Transcript_11177:72-893(+)|eukprot:CAMPEP_0172526664 /NCGR_PEP_ID=MMETSP1067-20121228/1523_1 /TAXON_ID=265564 ORGANISM="Thalassiosira punctigera, Strain Tpunct2005C2" /NCGR_SAMPLE_ID=MMETSP1067 /ASSEMBLY_ACC=CAM_ASM_000444 /LENGTH=273 /DNA_ID=CAMNT_0013310219 /DNA_START=68 /DNA_END=889 /DNA_ORIENTATION=-